MLRLSGTLILSTVLYSGFSYVTENEIQIKKEMAEKTAETMQKQISLANADLEKIRTRTAEYQTRIDNLRASSEQITEKNKNRNSIPNLLNRIMFTVPKSVQITSIKNTEGDHVVITAQSEKYEQLGYLKGQLSVDGILVNVKSDSGVKQGGIIKVTIEGDLP